MKRFICKSWFGALTLFIGLVLTAYINNPDNIISPRIETTNYHDVVEINHSKLANLPSLCDIAHNPKLYKQDLQFRIDRVVGFLGVINGTGGFTIQSKCEAGQIITAYVHMKNRQAFDQIASSQEHGFSQLPLEATVTGQVEGRRGEYGDPIRFHVTATDVNFHGEQIGTQ